ncbi:uncharacterized protein LOC110732306 [Chenopodium quinoa]|uniref:uncharacterized protein LOC110732306 n=1 Tax=Chenopodium quinoa TaxID=63459 RepID=UPI000B77A2C0|nr:uncharacterized protein LOC110732306 [Chenopodium quinoa]
MSFKPLAVFISLRHCEAIILESGIQSITVGFLINELGQLSCLVKLLQMYLCRSNTFSYWRTRQICNNPLRPITNAAAYWEGSVVQATAEPILGQDGAWDNINLQQIFSAALSAWGNLTLQQLLISGATTLGNITLQQLLKVQNPIVDDEDEDVDIEVDLE